MPDQPKTPRKRLRERYPTQLVPGEQPKTPSSITKDGYARIPSQKLMQTPCMRNKARNMSPVKKAPESPRKPRMLLKCTPDQAYLLSPRKQRDAMEVSPVRRQQGEGQIGELSPGIGTRLMDVSPVRPSTSAAGSESPYRGRQERREERSRPSTWMRPQGAQGIFPVHAAPKVADAPSLTSVSALGKGTKAGGDNTTSLSADAATESNGQEKLPLFLPDSDDEDPSFLSG